VNLKMSTLWRRLEDIPREVLYALFLIAFIIPMLNPFGLPIPISADVRKWFQTIDALPPGSAIMIDMGYSAGGEPELGPYAAAVGHHIFKKGKLKSIYMATSIDGVQLFDLLMGEVKPEQYGAKYGVDYVHIGYIAGTETAMAAVGKDIRATTSTDYKRNPLDQMSVMEGIKDATSFKLLICYTTGGDQSEGWVRQWVTPYKTPYLSSVLALMIPTMLPYYKAGQIVSLVSGATAGQYELLNKLPARGIKSADVVSVTHLLIFAFVVLGNIAYYARKASEGAKKGG